VQWETHGPITIILDETSDEPIPSYRPMPHIPTIESVLPNTYHIIWQAGEARDGPTTDILRHEDHCSKSLHDKGS
jgi:hypothetical protein